MKPWQAKWYKFRRLNPNRELIVMLGILGLCVFAFAVLPSARQRRLVKAFESLERLSLRKGGRPATSAEMMDISKARSFVFRTASKGPDIYMFMPSAEAKIGVLTLIDSDPGLKECTVHLIPLAANENPVSERAIALCLCDDDFWGAKRLGIEAPIIGLSSQLLDEKWSELSPSKRSTITQAFDVNKKLHDQLGKTPFIMVWKGRGYLFQTWANADLFCEVIRRF